MFVQQSSRTTLKLLLDRLDATERAAGRLSFPWRRRRRRQRASRRSFFGNHGDDAVVIRPRSCAACRRIANARRGDLARCRSIVPACALVHGQHQATSSNAARGCGVGPDLGVWLPASFLRPVGQASAPASARLRTWQRGRAASLGRREQKRLNSSVMTPRKFSVAMAPCAKHDLPAWCRRARARVGWFALRLDTALWRRDEHSCTCRSPCSWRLEGASLKPDPRIARS